MRRLLQILALISLAVGVIITVIDAARSLAATQVVWTPLLESWSAVAPSILTLVQTFFQEKLPTFFYDPIFLFLLSAPSAAVFVVLAALLYVLGARRERRFGEIGRL